MAHRERRGPGPAQPATRVHGWRFAQPDANGPCQRQQPCPVAATATCDYALALRALRDGCLRSLVVLDLAHAVSSQGAGS